MRKIAPFAVAASLAALATPVSAAHVEFLVTYEGAGLVKSTAGFAYNGTETFDDKLGTGLNFSTTFTYGDDYITLTYTNVKVIPADQYGGVDDSNYAVVGLNDDIDTTRTYSIDIDTSLGDGVTYFGYWLSALDRENHVYFFKDGEEIFSFHPDDVLALLADKNDYWGHPVTGENKDEPYVFLNFFAPEGITFNRIEFRQGPGSAGYESDNHTVGFYNRTSGTPVNPVPEPAAVGLLGAGLLGIAAMRRRRAR